MPSFDAAQAYANLQWLQKYPWFDEKPASISEFLDKDYLNIAYGVRPGVRDELIELFGEEVNPLRISRYRYAMFTGAIGIGKTTMASVITPYMTHWILCLKDPQRFYNLLPGSKIAFMQMSTTGDQAVETIFGDMKSRIDYCKWFTEKYPYDPKYKKQMRFPQKDIWILPGNSQETTFEGYNILGGALDEADSHKVTEERDYAQDGFDTIDKRIESRYQDKGFLIVIGQMKKTTGFAKKKYDELSRRKDAHTVRMTIWESLGWDKFLKPDGTRDSFWYDKKRKQIIPFGAGEFLLESRSEDLLEVPVYYKDQFQTAPEKALRDLAGIPPAAGDPFISLVYKIDTCIERWNERYDNLGSPVGTEVTRPNFAPWFTCKTPLRRAVHIDLAYSANGDACGIAMGHVSHVVEIEKEKKPYMVFDCLIRMHAAPGTEIMISEVRHIIYYLRDELGFKIKNITMDGFQSTDSMQQFRKNRFATDYLSIDKSMLPYEDLREAIYEERLEFPPYITYIRLGDVEQVQIAYKELMELETTKDGMVDHPESGSKDVTDAMAGVAYMLMGDRSYRRNVVSIDAARSAKEFELALASSGDQYGRFGIPNLMQAGLQAPLPPMLGQSTHESVTPFPSLLAPKD